MQITLGCLEVTLKYTYSRGKTIIYQRPVPTHLRSRYLGKTIKHDLKTGDIALAAKAVAVLNRRYEAEFTGLALSPEPVPQSLKAHAAAFLAGQGLVAGRKDSDEMAVEWLSNAFESKRQRHAKGDEDMSAAVPTFKKM